MADTWVGPGGPPSPPAGVEPPPAAPEPPGEAIPICDISSGSLSDSQKEYSL